MRWIWACLLSVGLIACQRTTAPAIDPDLPVVSASLPNQAAIQVTVRADAWIIDTRPLLPQNGTVRRHTPLPLDAEALRGSSAFTQVDDAMRALKVRAADGFLSTPVALRIAPNIPLEAVYPALFVLGQAGYGPFGAQVQTPTGEGYLPFEPRHALTASPDWHKPLEERGMVDWQASRLLSLTLVMHGPPRPCHALTVWQTPQGVWAEWLERWVRNRSMPAPTPQRRGIGDVSWTTFEVAFAATPVGERCASPLLISRMDVPWAAMLDAVLAMRALGFDQVRLTTAD